MINLEEIALNHENPLSAITKEQLPTSLKKAVDRANWAKLMPVQQRSIPYLLEKRDLLVQSRTGSGKTGAFLLPLLEIIDPKLKQCQSLILSPTRELASQIAHEANMLFKDQGIRVVSVYGGTKYGQQVDAFKAGAHIVVGTPGRILDHLMRGTLDLSHLRLFTFDEADRMLSVGFYEDMRRIARYLPTTHHIQTCMFSATFPPYVLRLADIFLETPALLRLKNDQEGQSNIEHELYVTNDKDKTLVNLIESENPESAIIFCNSKAKVHYTAVVLRRFGYDADELSGDLNQNAREKVLQRIRNRTLRFLIATDVAARGIDIAELSHVFQYDVPDNTESYVHRAGRTGRAGATGTAALLIHPLDRIKVSKISKTHNINFTAKEEPSEKESNKMVTQRIKVALRSQFRDKGTAYETYIEQYEQMVEAMLQDGDGITALAMLLDNFYQTSIHNRASDSETDASATGLDEAGLTPQKMESLALNLATYMQGCDDLHRIRMKRFDPLVEELSMSGDDFYLLGFLLDEFSVHGLKEKMVEQERIPKKSSRKGKRPSQRRSNKSGGRGKRSVS